MKCFYIVMTLFLFSFGSKFCVALEIQAKQFEFHRRNVDYPSFILLFYSLRSCKQFIEIIGSRIVALSFIFVQIMYLHRNHICYKLTILDEIASELTEQILRKQYNLLTVIKYANAFEKSILWDKKIVYLYNALLTLAT